MTEDAAKIDVTFENPDLGQKITLHLTADELEALGFALVAKASGSRPKDDRPLVKQPKLMLINTPQTEIAFERDDDGRESIALVVKGNEHRPIWLWFDQQSAIKLAHSILTISGGAESAQKN